MRWHGVPEKAEEKRIYKADSCHHTDISHQSEDHIPSSNVETSVRKLDTYVLFVVDDTISMLAQDYAGDTERLTAVKKDCEHIVDEMDGAKFAVITFNNSANLISPYSDDSNFAKSVLDSIYPLDSLYARVVHECLHRCDDGYP